MTATAKLFKHGRSQAVRLPKEFRMPGTQVRVTRIGERIILEPMPLKDEGIPWALIDSLGDNPFMPQGREQPPMPEDRVIFDE